MHCNWFKARAAALLCAAAWFAGTAVPLEAAPQLQRVAGNARTPQVRPLTVDNPFVMQQSAQQQPAQSSPLPRRPLLQSATAQPAEAQPIYAPPKQPEKSIPIPIVGAPVDAEAPVAYRLPSVSTFAPTPVDPVAGPAPRIVLPPEPPMAESLEPAPKPTDAEAARGPELALPQLETSKESIELRGDRVGTSIGRERSLLQRDLKVAELPLPPAPEGGAPLDGTSPQAESSEGSPIEPMSPVALPYTPAASELTSQLLPAVQRGYDLAQRGALFAAQTEFVQVLRRVAQAKDAVARSDEHSRALAAGLRALDEAEDFVPKGIQLEADLDLRIVSSSHRTPVLRNYPEKLLAQQAAQLYLSYAQSQLANAVAKEQAGSMALHGLGKIYARLAERKDDDVQFTQRATAMYSAALVARPDNHLAANELGVLLCRSGHAVEASPLFERAIDAAPSALAYHNLAVAQQKLGMHGQAAANEQESQRLAAWERTTGAVSQRAGVQWVTPAEMSRVAQPGPLTPASYSAAAANSMPPQAITASQTPAAKTPWQKVADLGRSLSPSNLDSTKNIRNAYSETRVARPFAAPAPTGHGVYGPGIYR